jgi:hypothetical protein
VIKVQDVIETTNPVSLVGRYSGLGQEPSPAASAGPIEGSLGALSGLALFYGAIAIVGGVYFFRTAPKESGFWKGWGYVNGVLSYGSAAILGLAALGLGGAAIGIGRK